MIPTLAGFLTFIRNNMKISQSVLPDDSPFIGGSFNFAQMLTNDQLAVVPNPDPVNYPDYRTVAVYNLGGHVLVLTAQDADNAPIVAGSNPQLPYFAYLRKKFNLEGFVSGIVTSAGDESTNTSLAVPDWYKDMTFQDLQFMQTPWGRQYLALAQAAGPNVWDIS